MANADVLNGLRPYRDAYGKPYNGQQVKMFCDANLNMGDAVITDADGLLGYQSCARATGTTDGTALGVVVGWEVQPDNMSDLYYRASTTKAVYICTDPDMSYIIQGDGVGTIAISALDVGLNIDFATIAAVDTTTGKSGFEADESTTGATAIATPLHLLGILDTPDNEIGVANQKLIVKLNMHAYAVEAGTTTGV